MYLQQELAAMKHHERLARIERIRVEPKQPTGVRAFKRAYAAGRRAIRTAAAS